MPATFEEIAGEFPNYHDTIPRRTRRFSAGGAPPTTDPAQWLGWSAEMFGQLLERALAENRDIRPIGGDWSFSALGHGGNALFSPAGLGASWEVEAGWLHPQSPYAAESLILVSGGLSIRDLNLALEKAGRSLWTSGASNGQSIAGAIATGTHGSVVNAGGIQLHVVGIQLVVAPGRSVWLEPRATLAPSFIGQFSGEHLVREDLFSAAQVHLGGLGYVNAVLLHVAPIYHLGIVQRRQRIRETHLTHLQNGNFTAFADLFDFGTEKGHAPWFVQLILNPYDPVGSLGLVRMLVPAEPKTGAEAAAADDRDDAPVNLLSRAVGILRTARGAAGAESLAMASGAAAGDTLEEAVRRQLTPEEREAFDLLMEPLDMQAAPPDGPAGPGPESMAETDWQRRRAKERWKSLIIALMYVLYKVKPPRGVRPVGVTWGKTTPDHKKEAEIFSAAIAVPRERLLEALKLMSKAFVSTGGAPTSMTVRFVEKSAGLLAFTRFPHNAVIDFDGLRIGDSVRALEAVLKALRDADFPFSQHWGKMGRITKDDIAAHYGAATVAQWKQARMELLADPQVRALFRNSALDQWGLT